MPKDGEKICEQCGEPYHAYFLECESCGYSNQPNVALAALEKPKAALEKRYSEALQRAETNGSLEKVKEFEELIKSTAKAVVNLNADILEGIINSRKKYINAYDLRKISTIAKDADSKSRRGRIDEFLFPDFGKEIIFAALALDGKGIRPYGNCTIILKEQMIAYRSSLLEEDSFQFYEKLELQPIKIERQHLDGYIAPWDDRHKLAVAKLADQITSDDTPTTFAKILLDDEGQMSDAKFIEIHILGRFIVASIESFSYFDKSTLPKNIKSKQKRKERKEEILRIQELKKQFQK